MIKAKIRKDLRNRGIGVPVGETYYYGSQPLWSKWIKDKFMVYYDNKWQEAESIDWDVKGMKK